MQGRHMGSKTSRSFFYRMGYKLLRFWGFDINNNIDVVEIKIKESINYEKN